MKFLSDLWIVSGAVLCIAMIALALFRGDGMQAGLWMAALAIWDRTK